MTQTPTSEQRATPLRLSNNFEPAATALIREMESDGWTGRIGSRQHAIMRAPDGSATCSVMPKIGDPRNQHNISAPYRRWKRAQAGEPDSAVSTDVTAASPVDTGTCPDCGKSGFATPGRVRTHQAHAHKRVACPVCAKQTSPAQSMRHLASHYRQADSVGQLRRDLARAQDEIERLRDEVATWQQMAQDALDLL